MLVKTSLSDCFALQTVSFLRAGSVGGLLRALVVGGVLEAPLSSDLEE